MIWQGLESLCPWHKPFLAACHGSYFLMESYFVGGGLPSGHVALVSRCGCQSGRAIQGEDVVAGIRTPEPIERLSETLPEAYAQLVENCRILEAHYKDMQVRGCMCGQQKWAHWVR